MFFTVLLFKLSEVLSMGSFFSLISMQNVPLIFFKFSVTKFIYDTILQYLVLIKNMYFT